MISISIVTTGVIMIYALLFEDNEEYADKRTQYMNEHLSFLMQNVKAISAAGPLKNADNGETAGGLWIVEADSRAAIQDLIEADPFWPTGLRKSIRVLEWTQVFADGKRLIPGS